MGQLVYRYFAVPLEMCPLGCRLHIFLQRALVLSVSLGRTLVPLPPWDVGRVGHFSPRSFAAPKHN
jgi:hypothetical protein